MTMFRQDKLIIVFANDNDDP